MSGKAKHRQPPVTGGLSSWLRNGSGQSGAASMAGKERPKKEAITAQAILLLAVNALFNAGNALSGTFVQIYLWKAKNDFALIGWFAIAQQVSMAFTFWIAGKWVKEHNKMNSLRTGVAISALFYGLVLAFGSGAVHYVVLLGTVMGIAAGLFWLAFNVVYFEVTSPENRDRFNGWAGLLSSAVGMIAPWLSGWLITRMPGTSGYRLIFSVSLGVFLVGVVISFFLAKRKQSGHYQWLFALKEAGNKESPWRGIFRAMMAQGVREGVFGFLIALLVYISTKNEMKLGSFSLYTSGVAFISFYITGRFLKQRYRLHGMLLGALAMIAVILPFFWRVDYTTLLIFGIGTALFIPLYTVPITSVVFDVIGRSEESASRRVEYIVLRELGLNAGRFAGTIAFIITVSQTTSPLAINLLVLIVGSSPLLAWWLIRPCLKEQRAAS